MVAWRLSRADRAALDGEGGRLFGGRWTPVGYPAVHTAATAALAILERLVHTSPRHMGVNLVLTLVEWPDEMLVTAVLEPTLLPRWRETPAPDALQQIGLAWLVARETPVLSVPSAIVPEERNYLLNPRHAYFRRLKSRPPKPYTFDPRLLKR
jgi:RES domain-containing protein